MAVHTTTMSPVEVATLLDRAGIPVARGLLVDDVSGVAAAYDAIGANLVVVKAAGLLHKTEAGGVAFGLASAAAAMEAARRMLEQVGPRGLPFMVQEQASGMELLVGLRRNPELGAAVVVGLGGIQAEIHKDVARRLVPVTSADALAMLRELRSWPLLDGYRGSRPLDVEALCEVIVLVALLADEDPSIGELDLNPVMVRPANEGCLVVDARIVTMPVPVRSERPRHQLERMLRPKHIAVVGVSDDEKKVGARLFRYLVDHDFPGRLSPVHPSGGETQGYRRYQSLQDIEGTPDLVCVAVPARAVREVAEQAVAIGAGGVLVHSSDFAEVGETGRQLQDELTKVLAAGAVPLVGPNSMGVVAPRHGLAASISGGLEMTELTAGRVALLTSSGALGSCLATRLMGTNVGISYWIHVGNEGDLVLADFLEWLADDEDTHAIGLLVEDIKDGPRFVEAGRRLARAGKPMFAYNMVRSERGREAALSHTGAMVGAIELREEVIRAAGMVSVPSLRVLEDALLLTSAYDLPRGQRLVAITFSGGASTIIADEAERFGIDLPELSQATAEAVRSHVPSYAAVRNPMDTSFQMLSNPESFRKAITAILADNEFDAALVQFTTNADPFAERLAESVVEVLRSARVPIYVSRFGGTQLAPRALKVYNDAGIPVLDAPDRAAQAIAAVMMARRAIDAASRSR